MRRQLTLAIGSAALQAPARLFAQVASEASVKAAYLYKFLAYVEWPPGMATEAPDAAHAVGVFAADAVLAELQALSASRGTGGGRPLLVRRVSTVDGLDRLHAIYIGRSTAPGSGMAADIMAAARLRPLLLVTDEPGGLVGGSGDGGMLNFVLVDGRVRFEASAAAAERVGLRLSSRLLRVAERVLLP